MSDRPRASSGVQTTDVFVDLSDCLLPRHEIQNVIERWARPESLGGTARKVTGVVSGERRPDGPWPSGWTFVESESPRRVLNGAIAAAGSDGFPLLLLLGAVGIDHDAVGTMLQVLERDPMFGFAVPRVGCVDRCCFAGLSRHGVGTTEWLCRKILAELPEREILADIAGPCILVRPQVLGNFGGLDTHFEGFAAAMLHYMASARRCGFRAVLCNRAVVGIENLACADPRVNVMPQLSPSDMTSLRKLVPELERTWLESRAETCERFERLCSVTARGPKGDVRPSLLIDVRNVVPIFNGTTEAVLGLVTAIRDLRVDWDVALLANPRGAAFHDLGRAYADWTVHTVVPERPFTVALRPSQPWHIQEIVDLHGIALFNAYLMLDTISWDSAYSAPPHLESVWQFLADHADALLFDSDFTRQRFVERFPAGRLVPSVVTHFSFDPDEYTRRDLPNFSGEDFILVVGNNLYHKDVRQTVEALASAFPFQRIKALGPANTVSPLVTAYGSGDLPELEMHTLYASAQYVVYPSFYEGFGFPILRALAYGRTVLARRSALLEEVAAQCSGRGRLVMFERREELVELIGRLLHGHPVPEYPLGAGLPNGVPKSWRDSARDTLDFLGSLVLEPSRSRWIAREHAARQFASYRH